MAGRGPGIGCRAGRKINDRPRSLASIAGALPVKSSKVRYTIVDNHSSIGKRRQQRGCGVPNADELGDFLAACSEGASHEDFAEVLGGPTRPIDGTLNVQVLAQKLEVALRGSAVAVIVYEENASLLRMIGIGGGRAKVVGMGRAVTDGSLVATVHDVMVRPEYRRQGVGRRVLRLLCRYLDTNLDVIDVGTTCYREETKEFLGKVGFGDDDEGSTAMRYSGVTKWR